MVNVNEINSTLLELIASNKKPAKILLGYKAYSELMNDRRFSEEIMGSAINSSKRTYKNVKIKVTQDDYQFEIKHSK